ncbi:MAG: hypothetical protein GC181_06890 [Bacteroidetes bacterium]|nr:hypothetical protein [Bacteroidota bacterium]
MGGFTREKTSIHQRMAADAATLGMKIPHIHALVELDITNLRKKLREIRKTNRDLSLTGCIVRALALAIYKEPSIQRMPAGRELISFHDVDVFFPLENQQNGRNLHSELIRNVQDKSVAEISERLKNGIDGNLPQPNFAQRVFLKLPRFSRKQIYNFWLRHPVIRKKYFGTVYISSIMNYSADRRTWGIPLPMHSLGIFIGTHCKRLIETNNGLENRDMVQFTISVDHRVNNGGDMGRFAHRLKFQLESEQGISEIFNSK